MISSTTVINYINLCLIQFFKYYLKNQESYFSHHLCQKVLFRSPLSHPMGRKIASGSSFYKPSARHACPYPAAEPRSIIFGFIDPRKICHFFSSTTTSSSSFCFKNASAPNLSRDARCTCGSGA